MTHSDLVNLVAGRQLQPLYPSGTTFTKSERDSLLAEGFVLSEYSSSTNSFAYADRYLYSTINDKLANYCDGCEVLYGLNLKPKLMYNFKL